MRLRLTIAVYVLLGLCWRGAAQELSATAAVENQQVFAGEPFVLQIQIEGSDTPEKPELNAIPGFAVQDLGGQQNSSESVTIVNNQVSRVVRRGYIFSYHLTAAKPGMLTIPSVTIRAGGKTLRTQPIAIHVVPPSESMDFKLRLSLSETKAYVGQPVILTLTWYVGKSVQNYAFNVPILTDKRFTFADPKIQIDPDRHLEISLPGGKAIAEKGQATLDGREFLTVQLRKILIPRQAGEVEIPQATVAGQAQRVEARRRSIFDDDFFGFARGRSLESFVVPSNTAALEVLDLPQGGRPPNFSGLVGQYKLSAEAAPAEVNVGDPITLSLRVSGPEYLNHVDLPPLSQQLELGRDFKIPAEQAPGVVEGNAKKFTQTIRAVDPDVKEIPPIELAYFNPKSGAYEIARTTAIPLTVKGTRVVTARDAEGSGPATTQSGVKSREGGIAYNYEGPDVLLSQAFGPASFASPAWLAALGVPPLVFAAFLGMTVLERRRGTRTGERKARRAFRDFSKRLAAQKPADTDEFYAAVLETLRRYLGDKLGLTPQALTFRDVRPVLQERSVNGQMVEDLAKLFERCEAGRYAGAAFRGQDPASLKAAALDTIGKLEQALG
jgi:hypothetical protein